MTCQCSFRRGAPGFSVRLCPAVKDWKHQLESGNALTACNFVLLARLVWRGHPSSPELVTIALDTPLTVSLDSSAQLQTSSTYAPLFDKQTQPESSGPNAFRGMDSPPNTFGCETLCACHIRRMIGIFTSLIITTMTTTLGLVKAITTTFKYIYIYIWFLRLHAKMISEYFRNRSSTSKVSHQNSLRAVWCGLSWATTYFGVVGLIHIMFDEQQNRGGVSWSSRYFWLAFNMQKSARCKNAVWHTVFTHRHTYNHGKKKVWQIFDPGASVLCCGAV